MSELSNRFNLKSGRTKSQRGSRPLRIIGINSGTSGDGLDIALAEFDKRKRPEILFSKTYNYSYKIRNSIIAAGEAEFNDGIKWMRLDAELGKIFGDCARKFLPELKKRRLKADFISSHGQTVRHLPSDKGQSLSLQLGDASIIARTTGLPVIYDFRKSDLAAGGQGAPLSPLLHKTLFQSRKYYRAVVNIGGISNITILPPSKSKTRPFAADCGPGNMAIDIAARSLFKKPYDEGGKIASKGEIINSVVSQIMKHRFFISPPPKSTGREQYGNKFVETVLMKLNRNSKYDVMASLTEITARGISDFILKFTPGVSQVILCGGGVKNRFIFDRLEAHLKDVELNTTSDFGYDPDYIEALLWAHLGFCFWNNIRVDAKTFTGARYTYVPGRLCLP